MAIARSTFPKTPSAAPGPTDAAGPVLDDAELVLEHRSAYRMSMITTWNMRCLEGFFRKRHDISAAGWRLFSIIGRWEPVFPSQVAQLTTVDADKVTRAVDRLVEAGFVERQTDPDDRRRVNMRLTRKGRGVYDDIEHASRRMEAALMSALSREEYDGFHATLGKLEDQARRIFLGADAWKRIPGLDEPESARRRPKVRRAA